MELSGKNAEESFVIQEILAEAHNYNQWIYDAVQPALGRRVVDVGSGFGNLTRKLLDRERVVALDVEPRYVEYLRQHFGEKPNFEVHLCDILADDISFLDAYELDSATCLNVAEHVEDDVAFLSRIASMLVPGGRLGLIVPAMMLLYGTMDRADRHFRRYARRELREKLTSAGFDVETLSYMNRPGAIAWFINGRVLRKELIDAKQLGVYEKVIPFVRMVEKLAPLPFGQSLVAIARKR